MIDRTRDSLQTGRACGHLRRLRSRPTCPTRIRSRRTGCGRLSSWWEGRGRPGRLPLVCNSQTPPVGPQIN
eukprot:scaffold1514_cov16-Prasinocladus_malaysianus.AAC.1